MRAITLVQSRIVVLCAVATGLVFAAAGSATAGGLGFTGWGVRAGFSSDPDQFVIGAYAGMGELAENLRLQPTVDIGFGDHLTILTISPDLTYAIPAGDSGRLYFGGTLGILYWKMDKEIRDWYTGRKIKSSGFELGVAAIAGYEFILGDMPLHLDLKIGITDEYPDLKLLLGYTFRYN